RRARWSFILLALLTNLGGGPMAWAHLATSGGHCHTLRAPSSVPAAPDCHGQQSPARDHASPIHSLPCCEGGTCACAAPPAPAVVSLTTSPDLRHDTARASPVT